MAIPFLNNISLNNNEIQNVKLHNTANITSPGNGQIYFDTDDNIAKYWNGTSWVDIISNSNDFLTGLSFNTVDGVLTATVSNQSNVTVDLDGRYALASDIPANIVETVTTTDGTYINLTPNTATDGDVTITAELSAIDGDAVVGERYLTKNNTWAEVASIPGTYSFKIRDNATPLNNFATVSESNTVKISASSDLTSNLTGEETTTKEITIGLNLGSESNYILNQDTATPASDDTIPFSDFTDNPDPTLDTNIVKKATFGSIPVESLTLVKQYIDNSVAGGLVYQGGYNADTNTPNLDTPPTGTINKGFTYTVTVDGVFFTEQVRVGDVLIAEIDNPTTLADWTTVQNNVDLASPTQIGIGNIKSSAEVELQGLSVAYEDGTATAGLDIANLTEQSPNNSQFAYIPFYDGVANANLTISYNALSGKLNEFTSKAYTITDSFVITYPFTLNPATQNDTIIQLVDTVTNETVYADVERISITQARITFASTPDNPVRVLVQKIG